MKHYNLNTRQCFNLIFYQFTYLTAKNSKIDNFFLGLANGPVVFHKKITICTYFHMKNCKFCKKLVDMSKKQKDWAGWTGCFNFSN